jgi:dTDP-4-amino-4,6-dideoxygalactose transaminase
MNIPFYKPSIGEDEIAEVVDTLRSGWLTTGPKVKQFERAFAEYLGQRHAVAVNSCTAALHLALEAIGLKASQGVVVPTMTFAATAEVVRYFGARPILADCRIEDFNLDVLDAERRIQEALRQGIEVKAIVPMHYGGQIGDMAGVAALARRHKLKIIEDAAHCCPAFYRGKAESTNKAKAEGLRDTGTQGLWDPRAGGQRRAGSVGKQPGEMKGRFHGPGKAEMGRGGLRAEGAAGGTAEYAKYAEGLKGPTLNSQLSTLSYAANGWKPVGSAADISCYSFYANKTITTGEGGMACTENDEYADRMRIMSLHGISRDAWKRYTGEGTWYYEIIAPGFKYNLTDIAAAIGLHQVRKANAFHARRTELALQYARSLREVEEVIVPRVQPDRIHSWHLYSIRLRVDRLRIDRAQFIAELKQRGIGTSVHWLPLHMHPYYRETYGYRPEDFPAAAALYPQLVTLPLYPDMSEDDVRRVGEAIKQIVKAHKTKQKAEIAKTRAEG